MPCIGCNQACFDHLFQFKPVECLVNPRASHEAEMPLQVQTASPKRVMVIGGGPAGLSAAATAAGAGHAVTLYEKADSLGGQLALAGALDERSEFLALRDALIRQALAAGVNVQTNAAVDQKLVASVGPDVVILAAGGEPIRPPIPGVENANVVQAWDVLAGRVDVGKEVVIIGGGAVGIETAVFLAKIGTLDAHTLQFLFLNQAEDIDTLKALATKGIKQVTVIEMLPRLGADIGFSTRWVELSLLRRYGVKARTHTKAVRITPEGVMAEHDGATSFIACDTVVLAVGTRANTTLKDHMPAHMEVITIGDALKPRKAYDAIREGFAAARSLD